MKKLIVAVDGTAGSGKTVTFKKIAQILNYCFIDTGLMYRAFTIYAVDQKVDFTDQKAISQLVLSFDYQITNDNQVLVNGVDVTNRLQGSEVLRNINNVTINPDVRNMMVEKQRQLAFAKQNEGVIEVGRDITSIVLPNADLKIYLDSSVSTRAQRRFNQNIRAGILDMEYEEIEQAIIGRDKIDKQREVGPLVLTKDAWYIDNSELSLDQVVKMIVDKIKTMEEN